MMKSTRNLKVLARFVDVTMIMVLVVCGFIIIKSHIDIAKGYIGQQEVTAVRIFDNLFVIDENNNRRYWKNVKNFLFAEDALIIEAVDPEDASNITIRLHRREMSLKTFSGKPMQVVYDFSELTLEFDNGKKKTYDGVKSAGVDKSQQTLYIVYFNGKSRNMKLDIK